MARHIGDYGSKRAISGSDNETTSGMPGIGSFIVIVSINQVGNLLL